MADVDDLKDILKNGKALIVCGAGVSAALTGGKAPGWGRLIQNALDYAKPKTVAEPAWVRSCKEQLAPDAETSDWLDAATKIQNQLDKAFYAFLKEQLRPLDCVDEAFMAALAAMKAGGNVIATTNYDDLLWKGLRSKPVTWCNAESAVGVVMGKQEGVLHLHGHWEDIESVIFSGQKYGEIRENEAAQFLQRLATFNRTLVFVGCSKNGLADENVGELLTWFSRHWSGLGKKHYVLCLDSDQTGWDKALTPIGYGADHGSLSGFLNGLAPKPILAEPRLEPDPQMIGRGDVKARILDCVQADNRPVIISGGPGMGKSAMALSVAHDAAMKARFGDERYFLRLDAAGDAHALATFAARALGVPVPSARAEGIAEQIARSVVRPTLLVLDNLESPWGKTENRAEVENVIARLAACPQLQLILTIRGDTPNLSCAAHETGDIDDLNADDSLALFHRATRNRFAADADVPALMQVMAGHPLCITLMAAQADGVGVKDVLARWEKQRAKMVKKDGAEHRLNNLEISVGLSFERLSAGGKRLARLVARLPAGFAMWMAREILGDVADDAALELVRARVVKQVDERLSMLAPLREAMLVQAVQKQEDENSLRAKFLVIAGKGNRGTQDMDDSEIAEIENLDAVLNWSMALGDESGLSDALLGLTMLYHFTGRGSAGSLMTAIMFWNAADNMMEKANCLYSLGNIALGRSDHAGALATYEEALPLFREVGALLGEANCILSLGDIALQRSDHAGALAKYEEALPLYRTVGNVLGEANCILGLGDIALQRSDHAGALVKYEEALPLYRKVGAVLGEANCIQSLGDMAFKRSDHVGARARYEEALPLYRKVGAVVGEANCFRSLGDIAEQEQDAKAAASLWREALALYGRIPEPYSMGHAHRQLARAVEGDEKVHHLAEARRLWLSIDRADLVAKLLDGG